MKRAPRYIFLAVACLLFQGWLSYHPEPVRPPKKQDHWMIYSWPADARLEAAPFSGVGVLYVPYPTEGRPPTLQVTRTGYEDYQSTNASQCDGQMIRLQTLWWKRILDQGGWLAAALFGVAAWRARPRPVPAVMIGPYRVDGLPRRGAMGEVYRAQGPDGTWVAVKVMLASLQDDPEFKARFLREASICQPLDHPNVVKSYGHGQHEGCVYLAQEWIDGTSLAELSFPLPRAQAWMILDRVCQGLQAAHASQIVHRDLKPENILLRSNGEPVIVDFGLARGSHYATITKTDTTLGTPGYMPPEQVMGNRSGPQADLYSLGCLAFVLLTGRLPFQEENAVATMIAHLNSPAPPAGVDADWDQWIHDLLQKLPNDRPQGAGEVLMRLQSLRPKD